MSTDRRVLLSVGCFALLLVAAFALAQRGFYGWTLFVMLPFIAGALGTWCFRPATAGSAMRTGASIGVLGCGLFLLLGKEGYICVLMALPVVVPLTTVGSSLAYWGAARSEGKRTTVHRTTVHRTTALGLLLPVSMLFGANAKPPVYSVMSSIVVNADPERVWKNVVAFPNITEKPDWVLRTGLAYPMSTRIEGSGAGAPRNCDLSTGTVRERVVVWEEPRLLRFVVTATPPAMKEMGLYGPIYPRHLNGYYVSKEGQFELTPLPGGRTLVVGTSWYQHGLWPAEYWR